MVGSRSLLAALAAIVIVALPAAAADLDFSASVDRTTVGLGEQFQLVLTVQGEDMISVPSPALPPLPDLNILGSSTSQSTNISFVNGQMRKQATVSFMFALSTRKLGKTVIPPCKINYRGKDYLTQPIEITVVQGAQTPPAATPMPPAPGSPAVSTTAALGDNVFLSVTPSRRAVYVGEPVMVEIALCTRLQITNGGWGDVPAFDGFWAEKIFEADKFDFQRRTIGGKGYAVSLLKKVALFPLSPGEAVLKPMAFNVAIAQAPRDAFDVFGSTRTVKIESRPLTLKVLPLPEAGKPAGFSGGVGAFTLAASLDRTTTTNSEPINLVVKVTGTGNIRMIDKPVLAPIPGLRILDPEVKDDVHVAGDGVRGTKTFRFPIIPQSDGKYVLAPIVMAYFDPEARTYKTLHSTSLEFSASGSASTAAPLAEASGIKVLGSDIGYIKPDAAELRVSPMNPPAWPHAFPVVSLGILGGAFWYRGHRLRLLSDRGYARMSRSSGLAKRRLRQAEGLLKSRDPAGFYAALYQAVLGYLGDRFNIDTHALTREQLRAELERVKVAPDVSAAVLDIVDQCEVARFSPGMLGSREPRELFEAARNALGRV